MAGSPGSGKTTALKGLGLTGINIINADNFYEAELARQGMALDGKPKAMAQRAKSVKELEKMEADPESSDEEKEELRAKFEKATQNLSTYSKIFNSAMTYKKTEYNKALEAGEDFILDGTAGNKRDTEKKKAELEAAGFDVAMIYLDIDLDSALSRNVARGQAGGRELLRRDLEASHKAVTKNKEHYQNLFGDNFFYVKVDDDVATNLASIKPDVQQFIDNKQLEESDYPITKQRADKEINQIIRPSKPENAQTKLPGWKRAKADYKGSAPPGAGGS